MGSTKRFAECMYRLRIHWLIMPLLALPYDPAGAVARSESLVYIGTYTGSGSEGIYAFRFDPASGEARPLGLAASTVNPSFLAADPRGRFLYAVNEVDSFENEPVGSVSAFAVDSASGRLELLQRVSSLGTGPAYVSLESSGRFLMVANYGGGNVAVFPIAGDGRLGPHTAFMQAAGSSVHPVRQTAPHAHSIDLTRDNRYALVADLGLDRVLVYRFDATSGTLSADNLQECAMVPGSGPRHIAVGPSGEFVYVVNELTSTVTVCSYEPDAGTLQRRQTYSTLPEGSVVKNTTAEILVDAEGKSLYVSNRGENTIVVFSIDSATGDLESVQRISCGGKTPRNIALDPTGRWLFSANQGSGEIALFQVDQGSGYLTATGRRLTVPTPVCVEFLPLR